MILRAVKFLTGGEAAQAHLQTGRVVSFTNLTACCTFILLWVYNVLNNQLKMYGLKIIASFKGKRNIEISELI